MNIEKNNSREKVKTYLQQGRQFKEKGNVEKAITFFDLALQLKPDSIPALNHLIEMYEEKKDYQQAIEYIQHLVKLQPNEVKILERLASNYIKLGKNFKQQGRKKKETNCYLKALEINRMPVKQTKAGNPISEGMPQYYQERDFEIVDYQVFPIKDERHDRIFGFRGPKPSSLEKNTYFVGFGPADTLGCYTEKPYLSLVAERIGLPSLNLGVPGCGATLLNQEDNSLLIDLANNSKFVIILVMSGRSHPTRLHRPARLGTGGSQRVMKTSRQLFKNDQSFLKDVIADMRNSFVEDYIKLVNKLKVPKILLYFSHRTLDYTDNFEEDFKVLHQDFPHFINRETVERVVSYFDDFVECQSSRGFPQKLINRFTGKPTANEQGEYNTYYASPEMHEDAAELLLPICQKYL